MKIAIMTQYYESLNYGGVLQAYALNRVLTAMGNQSETLRYSGGVQISDVMGRSLINIIKHAARRMLSPNQIKNTNTISKLKWQRFEQFRNDMIPHSLRVYDASTIFETVENYDLFVCGSDRIWHTKNLSLTNKDYLLQFAREKPRFAYAASSNSNTLSKEEIGFYRESLQQFIGISLREISLYNEFIKYSIYPQVRHVLDPVFLLSAEEWDKFSIKPQISIEDYILVYTLENSTTQIKNIEAFAKNWMKKIVYIETQNGISKEYAKRAGWHIEDSTSPQEFVWLIRNADYVITDSFHCTVFSVIFQKHFFLCDRDEQNSKTQYMVRINDLLKYLDIEIDHMVLNTETAVHSEYRLSSAEYNRVTYLVNERKRESLKYIEEILEVARAEISKL